MRPIVRPICRSICQSITGQEFRKYLNLDSTIYALMTDVFTASATSTFEARFKTTDTSSTDRYLFDTVSAGTNRAYVNFNNDTITYSGVSGVEVDGVAYASAAAVAGVNDGEWHTVTGTITSGNTVGIIGGYYDTTSNYWMGIIDYAKFTDSVTPANNQELIFDSGSTQYELAEEGSLGANKIVDGGFDTACGVNWGCGGNWSISGGVASTSSGIADNLSQIISPLTLNEYYYCGFDVTSSNVVSYAYIRAGTGSATIQGAEIGSYSGVQIADSGEYAIMRNATGWAGSVDNAFIKKLTKAAILYNVAAEDWTEGVV